MSDDKTFDVMVRQLSSQVMRSGHFLSELPKTLRAVLGENIYGTPMWRKRVDKDTGEVYNFDKFEEFVETPPTAGIGATIAMLRAICRDDPVAQDLIDQAVQRPAGLNQSISSAERKPRDRSTQSLRRLRKDHPGLHEKVLAGEMTVTQAAVKAGVYPPRVAISLKSPASAAATIRKKASPDFIAELRKLLDD
jgi:hypothetical protein